jgi:hypothetical protein
MELVVLSYAGSFSGNSTSGDDRSEARAIATLSNQWACRALQDSSCRFPWERLCAAFMPSS